MFEAIYYKAFIIITTAMLIRCLYLLFKIFTNLNDYLSDHEPEKYKFNKIDNTVIKILLAFVAVEFIKIIIERIF